MPGSGAASDDRAMIDTWLTDTFGLAVPVVAAPMAGPGDGRLAAAVCSAGGLGMVGVAASRSPDWVREQSRTAAAPGRAYGVGLMAWALEEDASQLAAVLDVRPDLVSVSFGDVAPFVARLREAGLRVAVQAGTLDEARRAVAAGADLVVARGSEGGGHGRDAMATLPLLQEVLDHVDVPVVAAGGVAGPRGLAAVLAAGAVGAWVGTAFLTTHEAATPRTARERLLAAGGADTAYGRVFDVAQRLGWPPEYGGRGLRNAFFDRWRDRLEELAVDDDAAEELARAQRDGDPDAAYVYAGQGVGGLTGERSVADVLADLAGAEALLRRFS
jgi:nitronate monooxygenase